MFGLNASTVKVILATGISPELLVLFRATFTAVVAGLLLLLTNRKAFRVEKRDIPLLVLYGIVGIVTPADFLNAAEIHEVDDFNMRMKSLRNRIKRAVQGKPQVVGTIMTRQVRVASAERNLTELIPLFGSTGHHHIPIVGEAGRLMGIITQSDVVAALCEAQPALA